MHHYNMAVFLDPNKADQASRPVRARLMQGALLTHVLACSLVL
eukprot:COSAG02_NODE_1657_length_11467_cov_16.831281_4_plen_43_part_00